MTFKHFHTSRGRPRDPRRLVITRKGYGPNWPKQRKKALERDNYTCQKCGRKGQKVGRYWDVHCHHIRKIAFFADTETQTVDYEAANHLDNLQTLCNHGCHKVADGHQDMEGFVMLR